MVLRWRGMQRRQGFVKEQAAGKPNDIVRLKFCGSSEEDMRKSGKNDEDCRVRESYAGQRLNQVMPLEGSEGSSARKGDWEVRGFYGRAASVSPALANWK